MADPSGAYQALVTDVHGFVQDPDEAIEHLVGWIDRKREQS